VTYKINYEDIMKIFKEGWVWIILFAVVVSAGILIFDKGDVSQKNDIAVRVNNEAVTESEFEKIKNQTEEAMKMEGVEIPEKEIKKETVEIVISQLLLSSFLNEKNLEITQEEINEFYKTIVAQDEQIDSKEDFYGSWESEGVDRKEVEEQVMLAIKYDKLFEKYSKEVEVTDEELREAYEEYKMWMGEVGGEEVEGEYGELTPFDELRGELKEFTLQEKVQERIDSEMEELKERSVIEGSQIN